MKKSENRALWTISYWYPPNFTGAGFQSHREHLQLVKMGVCVTVLTAGVSTAKLKQGMTVNMEGVLVKYLPVIPFPSLQNIRLQILSKLFFSIISNLSYLTFSIMCAFELLFNGKNGGLVRIEGYDRYAFIPIVIARMMRMSSAFRMVLLGSDDPDTILSRAKNGQLLEFLNLFGIKATDTVVGICYGMIQRCRKVGIADKKIKYIPYGVDTSIYCPVSQMDKLSILIKYGLDPNKRYILFVGSAIERKGIDILIDAFIQLIRDEKRQDVELLIVGPYTFEKGAYYHVSSLEQMVEQCMQKLNSTQCSHLVHWIGETQLVHEFMKIADVFCLPTRQEGLGIVIIEAMATGLPVVVSYLDGVTTDLVSDNETGVLIQNYLPKDYAYAIGNILDDYVVSKQLGLAARSRIVSMFDMDYIVSEWMKLF